MTCGKVLADKWEYYKRESEALQKKKPEGSDKENKFFTETYTKEILDKLGLEKYCCRRHMLGHVDIIDNL